MSEIIAPQSLENAISDPKPEIVYYPADSTKKLDIGMVVFPGGGYGHLAEHEGRGYAERLAAAGISSFVVKYRLGSNGFRHPAMLEDALTAIHTVRSNSSKFGLDPSKIGVIGSSAGGHLAAMTLTLGGKEPYPANCAPNFGVLCYPVISLTGEFGHRGSADNLLGADAGDKERLKLSCENLVDSTTPPCFIWHTLEDKAVPMENSMSFAQNLRENEVPFELRIYERGRHGLGLETEFPWIDDCLLWLKSR